MEDQNLRQVIVLLATSPDARSSFECNPEEFAASYNLSSEQVKALQTEREGTAGRIRPISRRYHW